MSRPHEQAFKTDKYNVTGIYSDRPRITWTSDNVLRTRRALHTKGNLLYINVYNLETRAFIGKYEADGFCPPRP